MQRRAAAWPAVFTGCLALLSAGCCRQGYVLHGDWSFGLKRAPGCDVSCPADANCADPNQCGGPNQCGNPGCASTGQCGNPDQCASNGRCAIPGQRGKSAACGKKGQCANDEGGPQVAGRKRHVCPTRMAANAGVPGPTGPSQGHPRFHPVPVRPVFGPLIAPQVVLPVAAPEMAVPIEPEPEELLQPEPHAVPNSAKRRQTVRRVSVQTARDRDQYQ